MRWLKTLFTGKPNVTGNAVPISAAALDIDVPRYPPFMKGLPTVEPERLIAQHPEILTQYKRAVIVPPDQYDKFYMGALRRFAAYAHLLPASQTHHHRGAGGLLRHSMEVALWSLQGADAMLLSMGKTPAQRRSIEPRWQLTAFLAGLCHDVGKPATDLTVTNSDRNLTWKPLTENLYDWAKRNKVNSYFLDWRNGRGKQHVSLSNILSERIIGTEALQWIDEGGTDLVVWLMEALNGSPGATNPLYDLVIQADSSSTERDLKTLGVAMAGYELGVPIERHLMDIMRRLIKEGIWQVNELGARVWNINGGIYLVWPASGEEIAAKVRTDDLKGFPRTADGILDMLLERGLAFVRESGDERFWKIVPDVLSAKIPNKSLACIRLRDDALISSTPIASVPGRLINSEDEESEEAPVGDGEADATTSLASCSEKAPQPVEGPGASANSTDNGVELQAQAAAKAKKPPVKQTRVVQNASPDQASATAPSVEGKVADEGETAKKVLSGKFIVDEATGEIVGVESGDRDAKKQPEIRQLTKPSTDKPVLGISKPVGLKIKSVSAESQETADPQPELTLEPAGKPARTKRKKGVVLKAPELEFTGSVGELFLALADDLQTGAKHWGQDLRVDKEGMVLLRWPVCFANYGLTAKTILDECSKNGWIWVDQDNPMMKLVDANFEGQEVKALRLMPDPGDALLYHAKYDPEKHDVEPSKRSHKAPQEAAEVTVQPQPEPETVSASNEPTVPQSEPPPKVVEHKPEVAEAAPAKSAEPESAMANEPQIQEQLPLDKVDVRVNDPKAQKTPNQGTKPQTKPNPEKVTKPQRLHSTQKPKAEAGAPAPLVTPVRDAEKGGGQAPKTPPANGTDPRLAHLIEVLDGMPAQKEEGGWRHIDRNDIKRAALKAKIAADRKDLNILIESNAKYLQVRGPYLLYQSQRAG